MAEAHGEARLRGTIMAASAVLGVPVHLVEGDRWKVEDGAVSVGLDRLIANRDSDAAAARVLLLIWESVREVRVAKLRRMRRLALARQNPDHEPVLATIDRLFAVRELTAAMPHLREPLARVIYADLPGNVGELNRNLQWLCALLAITADARASRRYIEACSLEVEEELSRLQKTGGATAAAQVLRLALAPDGSRAHLQRFERAYALIVPPFERLMKIDRARTGIEPGSREGVASPEQSVATEGSDAGVAFDADNAEPGDANAEASNDESEESARAGDKRDSAEGSDLFVAEQAGFVASVLDTPLPAGGAWADEVLPDDLSATGASETAPTTLPSGPSHSGGSAATSLAIYREQVRELSPHIERLREVWQIVISERIGARNVLSRVPNPEGEVLDKSSLVRIVAEVTAGVKRPNAYLSRHRDLRRTKREGSTDYILLIDRSASMLGAPAEAAADAALIMLESLAAVERDIAAEERALDIDLELALRTALIVYDTEATVVKPLSGALDDHTRRRMHAEIRAPRGSTNDSVALEAAARELRIGVGREHLSVGVERRRVVILVSDGGTDDSARAHTRLLNLRAAGVKVFGIGIRTGDLVTRFAPDGMQLDDANALPAVIEDLIRSSGLDRDHS
ncbi:vWA domain-containing protein [Leucobacter denitrificans]|uniref:VWA domain-containing protein n=1 Tax=Leucobacter denitrificans TaxID=683042 RepID=A0A7G9S5J0_9MICO|nr:vWA domain-containing protein [Leucobacter denitrificans]QNN63115.1 VWA domain-containing protein [Leucobacter denitrificans]